MAAPQERQKEYYCSLVKMAEGTAQETYIVHFDDIVMTIIGEIHRAETMAFAKEAQLKPQIVRLLEQTSFVRYHPKQCNE